MFKKLGTYVPGTSTSKIHHNVLFSFWKKCCRARPQPTTLSAGRPTVSLRDMLQVTLMLCQARSYGSQTGVGLPLLQCWVPLSIYHNVFFLFWKKCCRARPQPTTLSTGRPTVSLRDMLQVTLLLCQARSTDGGTGRVCGRCRSCGTWYE